MASEKTIARLTIYRRMLNDVLADGAENIYSRQLAELSGNSAAQVRRDLMEVGYDGNSTHGYDVRELLHSLRNFLDRSGGEQVIIVGVGNLGRALLPYFTNRRPNLSIVAGFDRDPYRNGRVIHGCRCHSMDRLEPVVKELGVQVAILTVPGSEAKEVAAKLVRLGIRGILNFAPVPLHLPAGIYVENIDLTTSLEKVAYFSRNTINGNSGKEEGGL